MAPRAALATASQPESDPPLAGIQGRTCLNCGTPLTDTFCAHCGQRAGPVHLSVRDIAHEAVAEHFGLDTKVVRTLVTLLRHPGRLTIEFLAGRRVRYVPPLRLYLSLSVLFFLASAFATRAGSSSNTVSPAVKITATGDTLASATGLDSAGLRASTVDSIMGDTLHGNALTRFFKRRSAQRLAYMKAHKTEAIQQMSEAFTHELPDALFLLVPGLALALSLLYYGGNHYYAEHLVFALHFQAFSFAALTIGLIPIPSLDGIVFVSILIYLYLALRRVYGEGRAVTVGKTTLIVVGYGVSLAIVMAAVGFVVFLFA